MGSAFVSYSHEDAEFVGRLAQQLRSHGIEVWSDHSLAPGEAFPRRIEREIAECAVFVPVMSADSEMSEWVSREATLAARYRRVVMPIGLNSEIFARYRNLLCEMTSHAGKVSDHYRKTLFEACHPSVRFEPASVLKGHGRAVRSIAFSVDGGLLATADDHMVRLWDGLSLAGLRTLSGGLEPTWPLAFTIDGRVATAARGQSGVHLWNPSTGALSRSLGRHERVRAISFSGNGSWLGTGGDDQSARIWSTVDGRQLARLAATRMVPAWPVSFSPDSKYFAVANFGSHSVSVWTTASWRLAIRADLRSSRATALCWNPEATIMISGGAGGDVPLIA